MISLANNRSPTLLVFVQATDAAMTLWRQHECRNHVHLKESKNYSCTSEDDSISLHRPDSMEWSPPLPKTRGDDALTSVWS